MITYYSPVPVQTEYPVGPAQLVREDLLPQEIIKTDTRATHVLLITFLERHATTCSALRLPASIVGVGLCTQVIETIGGRRQAAASINPHPPHEASHLPPVSPPMPAHKPCSRRCISPYKYMCFDTWAYERLQYLSQRASSISQRLDTG